MDDPFGKLAQALTGALGTVGRDRLQEMVNAPLGQGPVRQRFHLTRRHAVRTAWSGHGRCSPSRSRDRR
ncbi:hypothetical protein [Streptosporangium sandarakinum]|uniref:Uncharacterized protein n=1 Tax=Streptosporangium sandarakinum TaxID=1260955 RepID=A0A852UPC8_9ACTN|nr:hypothetical protein [Streptosporangium sandarakinum]